MTKKVTKNCHFLVVNRQIDMLCDWSISQLIENLSIDVLQKMFLASSNYCLIMSLLILLDFYGILNTVWPNSGNRVCSDCVEIAKIPLWKPNLEKRMSHSTSLPFN